MVANAIHDYLVSVEERVKQAEIRAVESKVKVKAAIARAEQERKSRRLTLALAASILVTVFVGGGAFLWMEQARATQAAETAHEVTTALEEAARLSTQAGTADAAAALPKWTAAVAAARRARAAIAAGEANEELTAQVEKSVAGYERREAKARKAVDQAEKNAVMLETLQNIRDGRGDDVTPASADRAYFEAFLNYGIDVDDLAPDKSAQAIVDSGSQPDLVAALDDWRWARSARPGYRKQNKRLLDVVVRADADEWLRKLRYAINADDKITLRSLAETADAKKRSANALHLLAAALGYTNEDPQKAVALLRKARRYHPQDFWINFTLAYWLTRLDPPQ
ncbi:MAG: hypothetical protein O7E54_05265, partial [Planctomycetota bacterium]|nr:hypothetical protein [Planctomycetota bacterium]